MNKKIVAVFCVAVLMVSLFAACGKKPQTINVNGIEYPVVTDDEGNTVLTDGGDVAVYVTDTNGKFVTDANGERQTNVVDFPNRIVNESENKIETAAYKWVLPDVKGWSVTSSGMAVKDDTERNIYIKVLELDPSRKSTFDDVVKQAVEGGEKSLVEIKKTYPDASFEVKDVTFSANSIPGKMITFTIKDANGKIIHHVDGIFFDVDGGTYKIEYASLNGYYDETVDLFEMVKDFEIKEAPSEETSSTKEPSSTKK